MLAIIVKDIEEQKNLLIAGTLLMIVAALLPLFLQIDLIMVLPIISMLLIVLMVIYSESNEEKNRGDDFLSTLPVSRFHRIGAKFVLILLESITFNLISFLIVILWDSGTLKINAAASILALGLMIGVCLSSIFYSGAYIVGIRTFTKGMLVAVVALQVYVFILSVESFAGGDGFQRLILGLNSLLTMNPLYLLAATLGIWFVLWGITAQFRKRI